jgi:hypothetical protein
MFEHGIDAILVMNAVVVRGYYPELFGQGSFVDGKYWDGSIDTVWGIWSLPFTVWK